MNAERCDIYTDVEGVYTTDPRVVPNASKLDEISGIGTVKKLELLKQFGSVDEIKNAEIEELVKVKGINEELAIRLKNEL